MNFLAYVVLVLLLLAGWIIELYLIFSDFVLDVRGILSISALFIGLIFLTLACFIEF